MVPRLLTLNTWLDFFPLNYLIYTTRRAVWKGEIQLFYCMPLPVKTFWAFILTTHMSEVKWSRSVVSNSLWPHGICSLPGSIHGIFQARILEWVAISFSRGSSQPRDRTRVSLIAGRRFTVMLYYLYWYVPNATYRNYFKEKINMKSEGFFRFINHDGFNLSLTNISRPNIYLG